MADIILMPGLALHDEGRVVSFQALSYCCGDPVLTRRIRLNGELFPITENLYLALQILRQKSEPIFLWVDAICIHQDMPEEKSQQVINIFSIYRKASQVDVWLGASGRATGQAMKFLCSATRSLMCHVQEHRGDIDILVNGICDLLSRPWFERIWVKQELYAASKFVVHCGGDVTPGHVFGAWATAVELMLQMQCLPRMMEGHCQRLRSFRRAAPRELVNLAVPEQPNERQSPDFHLDIINVLQRYAGSQCSQLQDHVYALLGMTDMNYCARSTAQLKDESLIIDYTKSTAEVFIDVTRHVIKRDKNVAVLHLNAVSRPTDPLIGLPSWVPDFRFKQSPLLRYFSYGAAPNLNRAAFQESDDHLLPRELFGIPAEAFIYTDEDRLELGSEGPPSSRLVVPGRRIGTLASDNTPCNSECYFIPLGRNKGWNVFHERHVYRHGVPDELLSKVERAVEPEVLATDLTTISIAVHRSIRRFPYIESHIDMSDFPHTLVNIIWKKRLLCSVVVVSYRKTPLVSQLWSVVSTDQYRSAQCLYATECSERFTWRGGPSSWIVPINARKDDLLIALLGSPLPVLVRLRPSTRTWEYVGSAVPCQVRHEYRTPGEAISIIKATERDREKGLLEEFMIE